MIRVFDTVDALADAAARLIVSTAREAVDSRGRFTLALSGGHSPRLLFKLLVKLPYRDAIPWRETLILWSDERFVPIDDEQSNAGTAFELLLRHVPVPESQILTMYKADVEPEQAAAVYEKAVRNLFDGHRARLDFTLLGCGEDGHTASLFPGSPVLDDRNSLIAAVRPPQSDVPRITMTPLLLNDSRRILFIAYGRRKAAAVHNVLEGPRRPHEIPAQAIKANPAEISWYLDTEAASQLKQESGKANR